MLHNTSTRSWTFEVSSGQEHFFRREKMHHMRPLSWKATHLYVWCYGYIAENMTPSVFLKPTLHCLGSILTVWCRICPAPHTFSNKCVRKEIFEKCKFVNIYNTELHLRIAQGSNLRRPPEVQCVKHIISCIHGVMHHWVIALHWVTTKPNPTLLLAASAC